MKITIAERLRPFSHLPGIKLLLPGSSLAVTVFPTRLEFVDLDTQAVFFADFTLKGPFKNFTTEADLEQGFIRVFGMGREGYLCYFLQAQSDGVLLTVDKIGDQGAECRHSLASSSFSLCKNTAILFPVSLQVKGEVAQERLSLGMHKSQEWEGIRRRLDFKEIFPLWHKLGIWTKDQEAQFTPNVTENFASVRNQISSDVRCNFELLADCQKAIVQCEKNAIIPAFENFFLASFEGIFVPRLIDTDYQGILPINAEKPQVSPLALLTEGAKLIRSLFFQETSKTYLILPCLPPQFHAGRMTGIQTASSHQIDFEWSKKTLRRLRLRALSSGEVRIQLPKGIRKCRIRLDRKTLKEPLTGDRNLILSISAGALLHLDRFQ